MRYLALMLILTTLAAAESERDKIADRIATYEGELALYQQQIEDLTEQINDRIQEHGVDGVSKQLQHDRSKVEQKAKSWAIQIDILREKLAQMPAQATPATVAVSSGGTDGMQRYVESYERAQRAADEARDRRDEAYQALREAASDAVWEWFVEHGVKDIATDPPAGTPASMTDRYRRGAQGVNGFLASIRDSRQPGGNRLGAAGYAATMATRDLHLIYCDAHGIDASEWPTDLLSLAGY